ncbi:MAG: repeat-associated core domain protein [Acidobacteria bacterium]|nr:repeat-associated core domain protein [Acidobacteriota bacterium]
MPSDLNVVNCPSGTCQQTTLTYDGHGRLATKHVPEQAIGTATTWNYRTDDAVEKVTDARGASQTFSYNDRNLVTGITYYAPSGISPTANVSFGYDAAGNRTAMTDGLGSQGYSYDQLSRLTSESRTFINVGTYNISYGYNLANEDNHY